MNEPPSLQETLDQAWHLLQQGVAEGRSPMRFVTLATVDADNAPQARTVVLRSVHREKAEVSVFTDLRSQKILQLRQNPQAALHLWAPDVLLQLRLVGVIRIETGLESEWQAVPLHMREAYGHEPPPGTAIGASDAWKVRPSIENFARLTLVVNRLESVSLDPDGHRRAEFHRKSKWLGQWLSP